MSAGVKGVYIAKHVAAPRTRPGDLGAFLASSSCSLLLVPSTPDQPSTAWGARACVFLRSRVSPAVTMSSPAQR